MCKHQFSSEAHATSCCKKRTKSPLLFPICLNFKQCLNYKIIFVNSDLFKQCLNGKVGYGNMPIVMAIKLSVTCVMREKITYFHVLVELPAP